MVLELFDPILLFNDIRDRRRVGIVELPVRDPPV